MNERLLTQTSSDKRTCERIGFNRKILLELSTGKQLECTTDNVSLGGVLAQSSQDLSMCRTGQAAKLFLLDGASRSDAYLCKIARITNGQLGLELDRKSAARFGKELTKGSFIRK